jgi:cell division protein FtsB
MRLLFLVLLALTCLIQYPLWLGKGGWFKVWDLQKQVAAQRQTNDSLRARNAALDAEVHDLQSGTDAIEDRARNELGMMRQGEVYVQILPQDTAPPAGAQPSVSAAASGAPVPGAAAAPAQTSAAQGAVPVKPRAAGR